MSENNYTDSQGKVICQICGKSYWSITPQHLKKSHNMKVNEYKLKFPDAILISDTTKNKSIISNKERFDKNKTEIFKEEENKPKVDEVITDIDIDKIQEELLEKKKNEIDELTNLKKDLKEISDAEYFDKELDPYNSTPKNKLDLMKSLKLIYPGLKNNYSIEKLTPSGHLEYKFITDMADPITKTIFEFPNTFWRNIDVPPNPMKSNLLKRDGWKVITIKEVGPNMEIMRKYVDYIIE